MPDTKRRAHCQPLSQTTLACFALGGYGVGASLGWVLGALPSSIGGRAGRPGVAIASAGTSTFRLSSKYYREGGGAKGKHE